MSKKSRKQAEVINTSTIFGDEPVLTAQQKREIARQEKAARKAERKEQLRQLRAEAKDRVVPKNESKQMTIILLVMIGIIVLAVVFLAAGQASSAGMAAKEGMTYFINNAETAEMGEEGISGVITEAYYTKNGGLYVHLSFANAEGTTQHPTRIHVKLMNGSDEVIASAATEDVHEDYYLVAGGYKTYELFIPKKYVQIPDDPLSEISYEITVESEDYHSEDEE